MNKSIYKKITIASLIMMVSVALSRVTGLLREMSIAYFGGTGALVDAYQVAFVIPEILNHILASGFLSVTFIPIFSKYIEENNEERSWEAFSTILSCFGTVLLIFIVIAFYFTPDIVEIIAPGLYDPETKSLAVKMTRIILPAQFFFFTGGVVMAGQFAREKFFIPAVAPFIYNAGIILAGVLLSPYVKIEGFSWGVLGGAFLGSFLLQYYGARKVKMKFKFNFNFLNRDLIQYVKLTIPLMVGLGMTFSAEFFLKFFGSYLPAGSIAGLNYGFRIMFLLVGFFGQAVSVASFPFMAKLYAQKKVDELNNLLNKTIKYLSLIIPFSVLLIIVRREVVFLIFQRGSFNSASSDFTSDILLYLLLGSFAFSVQTIVVRGYYASLNTMTPAVFGTIAVLCSLPLYKFFTDMMGACGLAFAISISATLQVFLLYFLWNRKTGNRSLSVCFLILKMILTGIVIGFLLYWFRQFVLCYADIKTVFGVFFVMLSTSVVFLLLLFLLGYLLKVKEFFELTDVVIKRFFLFLR